MGDVCNCNCMSQNRRHVYSNMLRSSIWFKKVTVLFNIDNMIISKNSQSRKCYSRIYFCVLHIIRLALQFFCVAHSQTYFSNGDRNCDSSEIFYLKDSFYQGIDDSYFPFTYKLHTFGALFYHLKYFQVSQNQETCQKKLLLPYFKIQFFKVPA